MFQALINEIPDSFEFDAGCSRPTITIPLTSSEDGRHLVALEVRLWAGHWHGVDCHEFKFAIVVYDERDDEPMTIFNRQLAASYVEPVREMVMPCVQAAACELVSRVQPSVIYRATYFTNPPEKSLPKHHMVTETLESLGYEVVQEELDGHQRHFWVMIRAGDE